MSTDPKKRETLCGVLVFHSETGTEGGYWAFQDARFIKPNTTRFCCEKCGLCWNKSTQPREPVPSSPGIFRPTCPPGKHNFIFACPEDWSYDGLRVLKDGDELKIFSKTDPVQVVWSGMIKLQQHDLFTENANGWWIHADQIGVERAQWAQWFFENYPAELIQK